MVYVWPSFLVLLGELFEILGCFSFVLFDASNVPAQIISM
mgnify:CR=1 FL=1